MIAYSDASLGRPGVAGLGVVIGRRQFLRLEYTASLQHAELQAVALAVQSAPPGPLQLHLDCSNAARVLMNQGSIPEHYAALGHQLRALAQDRGVALDVVRVLSEVNQAHPFAQQAATRDVRPALPTIGSCTVRVRRNSTGYAVQGVEPHLEVPHGAWGSVAVLLKLVPRLPAHQLVRVMGLTPFAAAQWADPDAQPDALLAKRLRRAQWTLTRKATRLIFPEDLS